MSIARFFGKDDDGNDMLLGWYDLDTEEMTYCVSDEVIAEKKRKITERLQSTANDIAMQNPTSPLFDFAE